MLEWLIGNLSTIVIALVLIVICGAIIRSCRKQVWNQS